MTNIMAFALTLAFWALFLGRTAMLMRRGVRVFVIAKGKRLREKALEIALVPLLVLWTLQIALTSLGAPLFGLAPLWASAAMQWVGLGLCFAGLCIFLAALISFGNAWRVGIDEQNGGQLVTRGVFAYSRNPIFLFMDLYFFGIFLVYPTIFFLLFFIGFAAGIHMQILSEERFLQTKFGAEYTAYRKRVRRYL